jgi:AraC-like DNA-binding protein
MTDTVTTPSPGFAGGLLRGDVLVEWYRYPAGPAVELARHAHEEYLLNLSRGGPGGVHYRGAYHVVPPGVLSLLMPGEAHAPRDPGARDAVTEYLTLYVRPEAVQALAGGHRGLPSLRDVTVDDPELVARFTRLHATLTGPGTTLEQDAALLSLLTGLLERRAGIAPPSDRQAHRAVLRARDYLHDHRTGNVSLAELAAASGLSRHRLTRLFTARFGMPPHAYQIALRVEHAKRLLLSGTGVSAAAADAGFHDLSHLSRHFKRVVGVPPGRYAEGHARTSA